jgi:glycosyltransferase involved in cell wall biosynthesis
MSSVASIGEFADVTIIMPAFRAAATIDRALASVVHQTVKPRAMVIVDDGSPDGTFDRICAWKGKTGGIALTVLQQANAGPGAARNRALAEASTTWVAFLDADDEWLPAKIERSVAHLAGDNYVLVAHDSVEVKDGREERIECASCFLASPDPYVGLYRRGFIDTTTVVARLDAIRAVGGFDASLPNAQDFELWLALLSAPETRFLVFPEVLSRYHRTAGSVMTHIDRRRRCCMTIAQRYAPALRSRPGSPVVSLWFRTLAVHAEALASHREKRDWGQAVMTALALAGNLIRATATYLTGSVRTEASRRDQV